MGQEGVTDPQHHDTTERECEAEVETREHLPSIHRLGQEEFIELPGSVQIGGPKEDPYQRDQKEDHTDQTQEDASPIAREPKQPFREGEEEEAIEDQPLPTNNVLDLIPGDFRSCVHFPPPSMR